MSVHRFEFESNLFLVDGNSGAVHVIDPITWAALDHYPQSTAEHTAALLADRYPVEDVISAIAEINQLSEQGLLFSELPNVPALGGDPVVKAMCLHAAHDCNLACRYCFAGQGSFGHDRGLMDIRTGKAAIDFLISHSGNRRHVEVDYFGGEPTLNMPVVRELVHYAREQARQHDKVIKQTLTTNGTLLDDSTMEFLNTNQVALVLSLDGRREVNDHMRPYADDTGSYDVIMPNLQRAVASRGGQNYYVRGTYTRHHLDFAADVLHMVDNGFDQVSVEPVVAEPSAPYALHDDDLPVLHDQYRQLASAFLARWRQGRPFNFFHFNVDLNQGPCLVKRFAGCGAGSEYVAVAPNGDIYPCHQFVGQSEWLLGSVHRKGLNQEIIQTMAGAHLADKGECRDCWAKVFCGGGCHANAYFASGSVMKPYRLGCDLQKMRLEAAIAVQATMMMEKEE